MISNIHIICMYNMLYINIIFMFICEQILKGLMVNINVTMHPIQICKYLLHIHLSNNLLLYTICL